MTVPALAAMGAVDTVSVVIRFSLVQLSTPDDMRGRVGAVNYLFVNASNQLGEFESGVVAAWLGAVPAALLGGIPTDASFAVLSGIPTISLIAGPLYMYDEADTIDKIDQSQLRPVAVFFADMLDAIEKTPGNRIGQGSLLGLGGKS